MMDFTYSVPTKVFFGRGKIKHLGEEVKRFSDNILLVYGGGSIKKTGLYDTVVKELERNSIRYIELNGVKPNPSISSVRKGVDLCRGNNIDFILAVGGGSVIDCSKTIAAGFYHDGDPWDLFLLGDSYIKKALPLGTVLTIAGTGSEMNGNAVITNEETTQKLAVHNDHLRPRFSILDPTYTFTVPKEHTAAGVVDIMSHVLEQYLSPTRDAFIQDRLSEAILKTCIHYGPVALRDPCNYEARANLMWASSLALNGLLSYGRATDWATHGIEHAVSALYDVTHGTGLAIITPYWMEYVLDDETRDVFVKYAQMVWGIKDENQVEIARDGIEKTRFFFKELGMPSRLREVGVKKDKLGLLADITMRSDSIGKLKRLSRDDVYRILKNAF